MHEPDELWAKAPNADAAYGPSTMSFVACPLMLCVSTDHHLAKLHAAKGLSVAMRTEFPLPGEAVKRVSLSAAMRRGVV